MPNSLQATINEVTMQVARLCVYKKKKLAYLT